MGALPAVVLATNGNPAEEWEADACRAGTVWEELCGVAAASQLASDVEMVAAVGMVAGLDEARPLLDCWPSVLPDRSHSYLAPTALSSMGVPGLQSLLITILMLVLSNLEG